MKDRSILSTHVAERLIDLNDLRIFAYVASLTSFSSAADALQIHKSSVSRSIQRLEAVLDTPLLERTTRKVRLTERGRTLKENCVDLLSRVNATMGFEKQEEAEEEEPATRPLSAGRYAAPVASWSVRPGTSI